MLWGVTFGDSLLLLLRLRSWCEPRYPGPRSKLLSVVLRLGNNFFGAHAWMACAKALNLNRPRANRRRKDIDRTLDPNGSSLALS